MTPSAKKKLITALRIVACTAMVVYLALSAVAAGSPGAEPACTGMTIAVAGDGSGSARFVTAAEIANELGGLPERLCGRPLGSINTESLRRRLSAIDKIEHVDVFTSTNGRVNVNIFPLKPVARVFTADGAAFYLNRDGKRMATDARYSMDVPVILCDMPADSLTAARRETLFGLIDELRTMPAWDRMTTMIELAPNGDHLLVPAIDGHIINLGTTDALPSKLARVERMYRHVLPVKGWNYYDTISVKWAGQVVATRSQKHNAADLAIVDDDDADADVTSMLAAEGAAPGQTLPGRPAHNEKPIPAAAQKAAIKAVQKPEAQAGKQAATDSVKTKSR